MLTVVNTFNNMILMHPALGGSRHPTFGGSTAGVVVTKELVFWLQPINCSNTKHRQILCATYETKQTQNITVGFDKRERRMVINKSFDHNLYQQTEEQIGTIPVYSSVC